MFTLTIHMKFYFTVNLSEEFFFLRFHFLWKVLFLQMNKMLQNMTVKLRVYSCLMKFLHFWRLQWIAVKTGHTKAGKPSKYCILQVHRGLELRSCSTKWVRRQQLTIIPSRLELTGRFQVAPNSTGACSCSSLKAGPASTGIQGRAGSWSGLTENWPSGETD